MFAPLCDWFGRSMFERKDPEIYASGGGAVAAVTIKQSAGPGADGLFKTTIGGMSAGAVLLGAVGAEAIAGLEAAPILLDK